MLADLDLNGGACEVAGGMSDRWLFQVPEAAGHIYFVEDAQRYEAKYGHAKFGKKLELMAADINQRGRSGMLGDANEWTILLLLGRHQPVCRSGCLPAMAKAGIVVQRRAE